MSLPIHSIGLVEDNKANHSTSKACYGAFNVETFGTHPLDFVVILYAANKKHISSSGKEMLKCYRCRTVSKLSKLFPKTTLKKTNYERFTRKLSLRTLQLSNAKKNTIAFDKLAYIYIKDLTFIRSVKLL